MDREGDTEKAKSGTRRTVLTERRVVGVREADSEKRKLLKLSLSLSLSLSLTHTHTHAHEYAGCSKCGL